MKKKLAISSNSLSHTLETEEQFAKRIRAEALETLRLRGSGLNKDALAAAKSLSEQASFLGDLPKKSKRKVT